MGQLNWYDCHTLASTNSLQELLCEGHLTHGDLCTKVAAKPTEWQVATLGERSQDEAVVNALCESVVALMHPVWYL